MSAPKSRRASSSSGVYSVGIQLSLAPPVPSEKTTDILGIVIPVVSPVFLAVVAVHVLIALAAVIVGIVAMLSKKGRGRHSRFGLLYFRLMCAVFATATVLAVMRWAHDWHLFVLGALAFVLATMGKIAIHRGAPARFRVHASMMGASYIVLLTAFYVDNGKNLPLWRDLPSVAYWTLPALVGVPIILRVLSRHALTRPRID
jgi:uncharacterized membrane protein